MRHETKHPEVVYVSCLMSHVRCNRFGSIQSSLSAPMMLEKIHSVTVVAALGVALTTAAHAQQRRPITFDDFAAVRAVADPQISPDGRSVLYLLRTTDVAANRRAGRTLLVAAAGGAARQFPGDDVSASEARWSPDGRRIAYLTYRNSPQHQWRIAIAEAGQVRTLYQAEQRLRLLGWARGNAELIFANPQNNASNLITEVRLARLNIKTGKATPAATFSATYFVSTLLAPDGKRVAFTKRENDRDELWVISLADGQTRKLRVSGDPAVYFAGLAWSPDSHSLYFSKQSNAIAFWAIDNFK